MVTLTCSMKEIYYVLLKIRSTGTNFLVLYDSVLRKCRKRKQFLLPFIWTEMFKSILLSSSEFLFYQLFYYSSSVFNSTSYFSWTYKYKHISNIYSIVSTMNVIPQTVPSYFGNKANKNNLCILNVSSFNSFLNHTDF